MLRKPIITRVFSALRFLRPETITPLNLRSMIMDTEQEYRMWEKMVTQDRDITTEERIQMMMALSFLELLDEISDSLAVICKNMPTGDQF